MAMTRLKPLFLGVCRLLSKVQERDKDFYRQGAKGSRSSPGGDLTSQVVTNAVFSEKILRIPGSFFDLLSQVVHVHSETANAQRALGTPKSGH